MERPHAARPVRRCAPTTTSAGDAAHRCSSSTPTSPARAARVAARAPARRAACACAFRHFALRAEHPRAVPAARAAEAAAPPGRVLAVARRALRRPGPPRRPAPVGALRARSGLDVERFEADRRVRGGRRAGAARHARGAARRASRRRRRCVGGAVRPGAAAVAPVAALLAAPGIAELRMTSVRIRETEAMRRPPTEGRAREKEQHMSTDAVTTVSVEIAGTRDLLRDRQDGQAGLRRRRRPPGRHDGPRAPRPRATSATSTSSR